MWYVLKSGGDGSKCGTVGVNVGIGNVWVGGVGVEKPEKSCCGEI